MNLTVEELQKKFVEYHELREEISHIKQRLSELSARESEIENVLLSMMEGLNMQRYHFTGIGTFFISERMSFKTPKTPETKEAFFGYLREKGVFDQMISVNSQTLNAFCKTEYEVELDKGNSNFKIPGIDEPTISKQVGVRKS